MGNLVVRTWDQFWHPELQPVPYGEPTFDPFLGIGPRVKREMKTTEAELRACKIPKEKWDYCAHTLIEIERCRKDNFPFMWRCKEQIHAANSCQLEDYKLRLKEYERERRLLHRQKRLQEAAAA